MYLNLFWIWCHSKYKDLNMAQCDSAQTSIIGIVRIYRITCLMQNLLPCGIPLIVKIILIDYKQRRI